MTEQIDFSWTERAACKDQSVDWFFATSREEPVDALVLCAGCAVRAECLAYALEHESIGVWGGTSAKQRQKIRRRAGIKLREIPTFAVVERSDNFEEAS